MVACSVDVTQVKHYIYQPVLLKIFFKEPSHFLVQDLFLPTVLLLYKPVCLP